MLLRMAEASRARVAGRDAGNYRQVNIAQRLESRWLEERLKERSTVWPEHLDQIPTAKAHEPGIVVEIMACASGGLLEPCRILIESNVPLAGRERELRARASAASRPP